MLKRLIAGLIIGSVLMAEIPMSVLATEIVVEDFGTNSMQIEGEILWRRHLQRKA